MKHCTLWLFLLFFTLALLCSGCCRQQEKKALLTAAEWTSSHMPSEGSAFNTGSELLPEASSNTNPASGSSGANPAKSKISSVTSEKNKIKSGTVSRNTVNSQVQNSPKSNVQNSQVSSAGSSSKAPERNGILSNFSTKDLNGKTVDQSVLEHYSLTMVNIWATYCSPCKEELPSLGKLAKANKAAGVQIIGVVSDALYYDGSVDEDQVDTAKKLIEKTGANYIHLIPSKSLNPLLKTAQYVPTTIFVDAYGNQLGESKVGARSEEEWQSIINQLLKEVKK